MVLPGIAVNAWTLGVALFVLGAGNGCLDVSMNAHAVRVEAVYRRPIMSAFHAAWSVGGFLAALAGACTLSWGLNTTFTLTAVSFLALAASVVSAPALLPPRRSRSPALRRQLSQVLPQQTPQTAKIWRTTPARIWALAGLAMILMLSEGVASD